MRFCVSMALIVPLTVALCGCMLMFIFESEPESELIPELIPELGISIRLKSELLLDSESIKNCAEVTTVSPVITPDKITASLLLICPTSTSTDLKRPSPNAITTRF